MTETHKQTNKQTNKQTKIQIQKPNEKNCLIKQKKEIFTHKNIQHTNKQANMYKTKRYKNKTTEITKHSYKIRAP